MKLHYMILKWKQNDPQVLALAIVAGKASWVHVSDANASHWKTTGGAKAILDKLIKAQAPDVRLQHVANPKTFSSKDIHLIDGR